jgi:hypothetical protein
LHDVGGWSSDGGGPELQETNVTLEEFRNLAKSLLPVREINRLGNETLFVEAVAIATLGWPDPGHAMVTVWSAIRRRSWSRGQGCSARRRAVRGGGGRPSLRCAL